MGGGNAAFRLEIGATGYMLNDYDWGNARTFTEDRRSGTGWREVARFHDPHQALEWVDEAVGRGDGQLTDFSIVMKASFFDRHRKLPWIVLALVTFAVAAFWASALLFNP